MLIVMIFLEESAKSVVLTTSVYYNQLLGVNKSILRKGHVCLIRRELHVESPHLCFASGHTWDSRVWFPTGDAAPPTPARGASGEVVVGQAPLLFDGLLAPHQDPTGLDGCVGLP